MTSGIAPGLQPYIPLSLLQSDGSLKSGVDPAAATKIAQGIQAKAATLPPAEAGLFLALARGSDLAPAGKLPPDLGATLDKFAAAAHTLGNVSGSTSPLNFLARVMIEQASEQRKNALNDRLAAREMAKSELLSQAKAMRDEADTLASSSKTAMIVSVVMASVSIVAGAISMGSSIASAARGAKAVTAAREGMEAGNEGGTKVLSKAEIIAKSMKAPEQDKGARVLGSIGSGSGSIGQGSGQLGQGVSGYYSTQGQADAKNKEAEGSVHAAQAQETQAKGDLRKEQQQALDGMMQSIIQFLKDLQEAKAQQMQALTRV